MNFIEMWREADLVDAAIGGVDSLSEKEYPDYVAGCLMALAEDFAYGEAIKKKHQGEPLEKEG